MKECATLPKGREALTPQEGMQSAYFKYYRAVQKMKKGKTVKKKGKCKETQ